MQSFGTGALDLATDKRLKYNNNENGEKVKKAGFAGAFSGSSDCVAELFL